MNRLQRAALAGALMLVVVGLTQADTVSYMDRATKKPLDYRGKILEESPGGIKIEIKEGKKTLVKQVPAKDVVEVIYDSPDVVKLTFRAPFSKEARARTASAELRPALLLEALDGYTKLAELLRGRPEARRYIQYKIAEVTVLQAQDDPTKMDAAIKLLTDFKTNNTNCWELLHALKTLARLQEDAGKPDDARKTYEELAEVPDVPKEIKQESEILVGRLLLRSGKYSDAEKRLEKLVGSMSDADLQRPFVQAFLAASRIGQNSLATVEKDLKEVIRGNTDTRLRAVAYNLLGDYYVKKAQLDDAFWSYLRVDAMYNEDTEEQAKALYHLSSLFDKVKKDPIRGKECNDKLLDKRFAGTMYQKLAKPFDAKEK